MNVLYPSRRHLPLAVTAFIGLVIQKMNAADAPEGLSKHPGVA
jgi:hypothetical protein